MELVLGVAAQLAPGEERVHHDDEGDEERDVRPLRPDGTERDGGGAVVEVGDEGKPGEDPQVPDLDDREDEEREADEQDAGVAASEPRPPSEIAGRDVHRPGPLSATHRLVDRIPRRHEDRRQDDCAIRLAMTTGR